MRIEQVDLRVVSLPLVAPFRASWGMETERVAVLVRVCGTIGGSGGAIEGWGECVAMREPLYSPEYVDGAIDVLRRHLVPRLLGTEAVTADGVADLFRAVQGHPMAKAAVELSLLDAEGRASGQSLRSRFGATRERVDVGVVVGMTGSIDEVVDAVASRVAEGYRRVKVKIGPGHDRAVLAAIRAAFPYLALWADANAAYVAYGEGARGDLKALDDLAIGLIEQPFAPERMLDHAALAREIATPVCLDETIISDAVAADALALGACSVINIKPGRVGGYLEAIRIHDRCLHTGIDAWCGGMLETGIGRAANLALAALPGFTRPGDISATDRYFHADLTAPFVLAPDGTLAVPSGPGIGVPVDPAAIKVCTRWTETMTR